MCLASPQRILEPFSLGGLSRSSVKRKSATSSGPGTVVLSLDGEADNEALPSRRVRACRKHRIRFRVFSGNIEKSARLIKVLKK